MILHTIMPLEAVFQERSYKTKPRYSVAEYRGEKVIVEHMEDDHYEINQLLSTCPSTFLNPAFQPGTMVRREELK